MDFSFDSLKHVARAAQDAHADAGTRVRVDIYVDASATPFLTGAVRRAFVPQTAGATVRVDRLGDAAAPVGDGTDAVVVLTCGGAALEREVHGLMAWGAPVVVVAESSVEAPFIERDTPLLGLVAATDERHLLDALARWILDRTEKTAAFSANFAFMRSSAAGRVIAACATANAATALIVWPEGADFPTMTLAQLDMLLELAGIYGKPIGPERVGEAAAVVGAAYGMRALARQLSRPAGRGGIVVKAAVAGAGSYALGLGLRALYEADLDCKRVGEAASDAVARAREAAAAAAEAAEDAGRAAREAAGVARERGGALVAGFAAGRASGAQVGAEDGAGAGAGAGAVAAAGAAAGAVGRG